MNDRIENYLSKLEDEIINGKWRVFEFSKDWWMSFSSEAGVYVIKDQGEICFVGESKNIRNKMKDLSNTRKHSLRRKIGNKRFYNSDGFERGSINKNFPLKFEKELNRIFEDNFEVSAIEVKIGRMELGERLVEKYKPVYNKKEETKPEEPQKKYSFSEIRKSHKNAYRPWNKMEEKKLMKFLNEGKSIKEIGSILGRKGGAISSRLKRIRERNN